MSTFNENEALKPKSKAQGGGGSCWKLKAKLFCETSFKFETFKLENEAFCDASFVLWSFEAHYFKIEILTLKNKALLRDFLQKQNSKLKKRSFSARLPSKNKLWSSKAKLVCKTSFKSQTLKLKDKAFPRDFLQKFNLDSTKRSFSATLPSKIKFWSSKMKLFCDISFENQALTWRSKTKHFCETSFKNQALKVKKEVFLQDFIQKSNFEAQKRSFSARFPSKIKLWDQKRNISPRLPAKIKLWRSKKHFCKTSFKNDMWTRHLASGLQYVLMIFKWMLQKYCACHDKVEPMHIRTPVTCRAKWSL